MNSPLPQAQPSKFETKTNALGEKRKKTGASDLRNDPAIVKIIEDAILAGSSYATAITLSGIGERTFYRWMQQGARAKRNGVARQFWQKIKRAEATAIHRNVLVIQTAARKDWRASLCFLERKDPENWSAKQKIEHSTAPGAPMQHEVTSKFKSALARAYGRRPAAPPSNGTPPAK